MIVQAVDVSDQINEYDDWSLLKAIQNLHQSWSTLTVVGHELYLLINCLFIADFADLDKGREFEILSSHLLN